MTDAGSAGCGAPLSMDRRGRTAAQEDAKGRPARRPGRWRDRLLGQRVCAATWVATLARLVVGGVWLTAGALKIGDLDASVRAVRAYRLLPEFAAQVVGAALPPVEIALGVLLIVGVGVRAAAALSALLLAAFVVGIASSWARGLRIDCGCFGSGGELAEGASPSYGWELVRDVGLLVLASVLAWKPTSRWALENRWDA